MLNQYRVYLEGGDFVGTAEVTLPTIQSKTAENKGAGIGGDIDEPVVGNFQAMSLTMNFPNAKASTFQAMKAGRQHFELWGSLQDEDEGGRFTPKQHKIIAEGKFKNFTPGKFAAGENQDRSLELELVYYKEELDGVEHIEVDKLNLIFKVDGEDQLAEVKQQIGM